MVKASDISIPPHIGPRVSISGERGKPSSMCHIYPRFRSRRSPCIKYGLFQVNLRYWRPGGLPGCLSCFDKVLASPGPLPDVGRIPITSLIHERI